MGGLHRSEKKNKIFVVAMANQKLLGYPRLRQKVTGGLVEKLYSIF
jgi:hypothetical protein